MKLWGTAKMSSHTHKQILSSLDTDLGYSKHMLILILTVAMETHLWLTVPIRPNAIRIGCCWHWHQISLSILLYYPQSWNSSLNSNSIINTDCDRCWNWRCSMFLLFTTWLLDLGHCQSKCKCIYWDPVCCWLHMMLSFWIVSPVNYLHPLKWHVKPKERQIYAWKCGANLHCSFHSQSACN